MTVNGCKIEYKRLIRAEWPTSQLLLPTVVLRYTLVPNLTLVLFLGVLGAGITSGGLYMLLELFLKPLARRVSDVTS